MQINTRKPRKWGQLLDTTAPEYLIFFWERKLKPLKSSQSVGQSVVGFKWQHKLLGQNQIF